MKNFQQFLLEIEDDIRESIIRGLKREVLDLHLTDYLLRFLMKKTYHKICSFFHRTSLLDIVRKSEYMKDVTKAARDRRKKRPDITKLLAKAFIFAIASAPEIRSDWIHACYGWGNAADVSYMVNRDKSDPRPKIKSSEFKNNDSNYFIFEN